MIHLVVGLLEEELHLVHCPVHHHNDDQLAQFVNLRVNKVKVYI